MVKALCLQLEPATKNLYIAGTQALYFINMYEEGNDVVHAYIDQNMLEKAHAYCVKNSSEHTKHVC